MPEIIIYFHPNYAYSYNRNKHPIFSFSTMELEISFDFRNWGYCFLRNFQFKKTDARLLLNQKENRLKKTLFYNYKSHYHVVFLQRKK
jgi:hypothetical protein